MTGRVRRLVASALAWIVGAVAAVAVGVLALSMIGDDLTSRTAQPLSPDTVAREASAAPAASAPPVSAPSGSARLVPAPATSAPSGAGAPATAAAQPTRGTTDVDRLVSSPGGSAVARCAGGRAYLLSWSPEQGYRTDDVARGPAAVARVRFESHTDKVVLSVRCGDDGPQATVTRRADDHGDG
ncbi:septum formation initiator [Planosporangium thailandense]|uniref:Septum formation initiator n=1 Tax=Planosporangium thailandense TaxID=765197 RepID=A0ABX0Y5W1_9ACTN|nr:septum formation initiator [Planosporangium thailandense]NJC73799.1 septum formation initiator [Planosporangium thailandense]